MELSKVEKPIMIGICVKAAARESTFGGTK